MKDYKDYDIKDFSKGDEKYFNLFNHIKEEIYSRYMNLPPISRRITFRDDGNNMTILEYLINNESEKGIINNIFTEDNDDINVTTYIVTFKNGKFCRNITLHSGIFKEDDDYYFEIYSENGNLYSKKEIKKEEINGKKL